MLLQHAACPQSHTENKEITLLHIPYKKEQTQAWTNSVNPDQTAPKDG